MTEEILGISDLARELNRSRQAVWNRVERGTLPEPDYRSESLGPLWKRSTLEKAKALTPPASI